MVDFLSGISDEKTEKMISLIKNMIGEEESKRLENAFENESEAEKLLSGLSEKEKSAVKKIMSDPALLSAVLSSEKAREGIKKFINER